MKRFIGGKKIAHNYISLKYFAYVEEKKSKERRWGGGDRKREGGKKKTRSSTKIRCTIYTDKIQTKNKYENKDAFVRDGREEFPLSSFTKNTTASNLENHLQYASYQPEGLEGHTGTFFKHKYIKRVPDTNRD